MLHQSFCLIYYSIKIYPVTAIQVLVEGTRPAKQRGSFENLITTDYYDEHFKCH